MKNKNLYIILGLLGVGGLVWYFTRKKNIITTTGDDTTQSRNLTQDLTTSLQLQPIQTIQTTNGYVNPIQQPAQTTTIDYYAQMLNNYNVWLNKLINERMKTSLTGNVIYQPTMTTQPLPNINNVTIPLVNDYVFVWQEIDNTRPGIIGKNYNKRWVIKNKNQITVS